MSLIAERRSARHRVSLRARHSPVGYWLNVAGVLCVVAGTWWLFRRGLISNEVGFVILVPGMLAILVARSLHMRIQVTVDRNSVSLSRGYPGRTVWRVPLESVADVRVFSSPARLDLKLHSGEMAVTGPCESLFGLVAASKQLVSLKAAIDVARQKSS